MLTITITPTGLFLDDLSDELYKEISVYCELTHYKGRTFAIYNTPEKLYKTLLKLSYQYDIELN